jgi:dTDP-4-amino-4,6-dideoxygalactose transaminase
MPVHYASGMGKLNEIYALANKYGLRVIEDAAHAFGCRYNKSIVGAVGDIICFSFDGIKNITSGEGGAVVTSDKEISDKIRDIRLLGVEKDTDKRYNNQRSWDFDVKQQGWRYHMSDIMASIGRVQLKRFNEFASKRVALAKKYCNLLKDLQGIRLLSIDYGPVIPHIFPIFVENGKRDKLREKLSEENIQWGMHYKPNHLLTYFRNSSEKFPITEKLYNEMLTIPLHPDLEESEVDKIVGIIKWVMTEN